MTPTGRLRVGRSYFLPAASKHGREMAGIPTTLAIGIWTTGACWMVAIIACVLELETASVAPLVVIGILTGSAEWLTRRQH